MQSLRTTKIYFSVIVAVMLIVMVGGSFVMLGGVRDASGQAKLFSSYLSRRIAFADDEESKSGLNQFLSASFGILKDTFSKTSPAVAGDTAASIPVLTYHSIVEEPDGTNVTVKNFEEQMRVLHKNGWRTIGIEEFIEFVKGRRTLPDRTFLLTFDDGAKKSYYPVDPIIHALGFRAVSFILPTYTLVDKSTYYLDKKELGRMADSGRWDIGSHSLNAHGDHVIDAQEKTGHVLTTKRWLPELNRIESDTEFKERITHDLEESRNQLEDAIKKPVEAFAFPFGDYGQSSSQENRISVQDAAQKNYTLAFYQSWEGDDFRFNYPDPDAFLIKRIPIEPDWEALKLLNLLESGRAKKIPFQASFDENEGWLPVWSFAGVKNNTLTVAAKSGSSGAAVLLDGTARWKNYTMYADVAWMPESVVSLMGAYVTENDYASCVFAQSEIKLEQQIGTKKRTIASWRRDRRDTANARALGISVEANGTIKCIEHGEVRVVGSLGKRASGGIGLRVWNENLGTAWATTRRLNITPLSP